MLKRKEKKTVVLSAVTLSELELLSEKIFSKNDLEIIGVIKLRWSWKHFKRVWTVKVKRVGEE